MNKDVLFLIQDKLNNLSKAEQNLADYILSNPEAVIRLSAKQLAHQADSSPATIIRFAKSIGLNGFTELKLRLSSDIGQRQSTVYTDIAKGDTSEHIKVKLKARLDYVLDKGVRELDQPAINKCIQYAARAKVIYAFGIGASGLVAQDIYQKFTRLGKIVIYESDQHNLASMLASAIPESLFIGISNSGETQETIRLVRIAHAQGLPAIAITSSEESPLARCASVVLLSSHTGENPLRVGATVSLISQLFTVDVLFLSYAAQNYDETIQLLKKSKDNIKELTKE